MPKSSDEVFRDFTRYTGDGQPNEPVGHPLPYGDPRSGVWNPPKADIRDWADNVQIQADRAEDAASVLEQVSEAIELIDGPADARKRFIVNEAGDGYELADRPKRVLLAYSQSNFANQSVGTAWRTNPPDNLFVWNGGNWNGDITPPVGTAFVKANTRDPQVPIAYAAELARENPETDYYLVIVARGGTGIRALSGIRYRFRTATSGAPAVGDLRFSVGNSEVAYNETDLNNYSRFVGTTDLGTSAFYPARIETATGGTSWIEFTASANTDYGDWRAQAISVTGSSSWPPADNTGVVVYPAEPRMRTVMIDNLTAAMTAAGLTGSSRRIDKLLIWPTEADINYIDSYEGRDFDLILTVLASYITPDTDVLMTLPYPYGTGIETARGAWWSGIRRIALADPDSRTLISLSNSGQSNWGDSNNIHVTGTGKETVGYLMRRSEATGGTSNPVAQSGFYTPTFTPVANIDSSTVSEAMWYRVGDMVTVSGIATVDPTSTTTATQVLISLPVVSDIITVASIAGQAVASSPSDHAAQISGHIATDSASMTYTSRAATASQWSYTFTYRIRG